MDLASAHERCLLTGRYECRVLVKETAGTAAWCPLVGGVRLWEVSVGGGSTVAIFLVACGLPVARKQLLITFLISSLFNTFTVYCFY